jgi:hypothetical protein
MWVKSAKTAMQYREYRDFEPRQVMCHRRDKSRNQISSKHPQICGVFPGQFSCASAWGPTMAVVVGIHNPRNSGGIQIERNLGRTTQASHLLITVHSMSGFRVNLATELAFEHAKARVGRIVRC